MAQGMIELPENSGERQLLVNLITAHLNVPPGAERPFRISNNDRVGDALVLSHPGFQGSDFFPDWRAARQLADGGYIAFPAGHGGQPDVLVITAKGLDAYQAMIRTADQGRKAADETNNRPLPPEGPHSVEVTSDAPRPVDTFFAYSHKDEPLLDEMREHLALLKREGRIGEWNDRKIEAGEEWGSAIDQKLETCDLILLLVSSSFINSDYCFNNELAKAIHRHEVNEARVVPIILRPCDWKTAPFGKLQALPKDARPVTTWGSQDEAWLDVVIEIRRIVEGLSRRATRPAPAKQRAADPVKDSTPSALSIGPTIEPTQSTEDVALDEQPAEDNEELGSLDLQLAIEHETAELVEVFTQIGEIANKYTDKLKSETARINQLSNATAAQKHAASARLADLLAAFATELELFSPKFRNNWMLLEKHSEALFSSIEFKSDEDRQSAEELIATMESFMNQMHSGSAAVTDARRGLSSLKGISKVLNRAVTRTERALDETGNAFRIGKPFSHRIINVLQAKLADSHSTT
jgi:hypothetical protein